MGLRRAMSRWLNKDDRDKGESDAESATAEETTFRLPAARPLGPAPEPAEPVAEPVAGPLVMGSADGRSPEVELPGFYRAPAAPSRPFDDPALLTRYTDYDRAALHDAWALVSERADQLIVTFYAELFVRLPEAPQMFPSSMTQQRTDFGRALVQWVVTDDPDAMTAHLQQLGADHRKYDVDPRHYEVAGAALASAWRTLAGSAWTQRHEAAVLGSYTRLASAMLDGAMQRLHEPASWGARIIEHRRILRDFAVLRIQPDEPYPYKAGQYLTLELPNHRRQWRQMSIATAPRADNSFDIHVRAVGALGVSAALVSGTTPGDRLRLGPPRGNNLVIEPGSVSGGLLCIASGTGAAPISAVVESVLSWREPPTQVDVFVGGRTRSDIYSVDEINRLIRTSGRWQGARAHGVIADDPGFVGYRGRVEKVVPMLRDWAGLGVDVLVAGPNPMIEATVANLSLARVPRSKIHFDQYESAA
jgi:NAD(P)H-flavin reductase/hemoglobin-like flavoprotein